VQRPLFLGILAAGCLLSSAAAQAPIYLKSRTIDTSGAGAISIGSKRLRRNVARRAAGGRAHYLVQFDGPPQDSDVSALKEHGAAILQYVHSNALLISLPAGASLNGAGVRWEGELQAEDKISPALSASSEPQWALIEFFADVDPGEAHALLAELGIEWKDNPDVATRQTLALLSPNDINRLAAADEVAYIFPASEDLVAGRRVIACASALTYQGSAGQFIAKMGDGWDGPGQGAADIGYFFSVMTPQLDSAAAQQEILRAFGEWARYAKLTFAPAQTAEAFKAINIIFAKRAHGDPYPFDGRGGALAHTFYPAPPNPEPLAGDMHFDDDESWQIGADTDLFSVALHETGHALGLGHSDRPGAVMYPYYTRASRLTSDDIAAILDLYAAQTSVSTGAPDPTPQPSTPSNPPSSPASPPPTPATPPSKPPANPPSTPAPPTPNPPAPAPPATPSPGASATPPSLTITSPAGSILSTSAASITLHGRASDSVGVVAVKWSTNSGASGTALGATNWTAGPIPLLTGYNTITINAYNAAGGVAWRVISVNRQ